MAPKNREDCSVADVQRERFLSLLLPVRHRLVHFARVITQDHEEAHDLVSDTILSCLERFEKLKNEQAFLSYLFTTAVRLHKRKRLRRRLFVPLHEETAMSLPHPGTSPEVSVDVQFLYQALTELPARQRETVALFEISGLSLEEIQEIQGGSLSGVKMRLVRGRERLKQILTREMGHDMATESR